MVNIFSVTSGKLFECHFCDIGKEFHCQSGKLIQCHVVNFFIDIHTNDSALLKALYLATLQATKKWGQPLRNWAKVYGEFSIMYEGRLPD